MHVQVVPEPAVQPEVVLQQQGPVIVRAALRGDPLGLNSNDAAGIVGQVGVECLEVGLEHRCVGAA